MDNFQAIGQLVIKAQDLLDSIKGGAIRAMETTFDGLMASFNLRMDSEVSKGAVQINTFLQTAGGGQLPIATYQTLIKMQGKVYGHHELMTVSPSVRTDPGNGNYMPGSINGILLWKIGAAADVVAVNDGMGFVGHITFSGSE